MARIRSFLLCWYVLLLSFLFSAPLSAQFYDNGQDPASLHWKKIDTQHYRLIFPEDFNPEAQRLANLLDYSYDFVSYSLQSHPRRIPVVVHNQNTYSNGMVVWTPKRVEFYTVPDPNSYPQDALEQLALHELRHVAQVEKINRGFLGSLRYLTGDLAAGGLTSMIPFWFLEGDAVTTETLLSHSGRGRLPHFEMGLRALSLEKGQVYSYNKSLLGSYKDYVPDRYEYGYQVVSWSRAHYGISLWNDALNNIASRPYEIIPVNVSFWKNERLTKRRLYDSAFVHLQHTWKQEDKNIVPTPFVNLTPSGHRAYTSYRFPRYLNDSVLIAEKSGLDDINRFVMIDRKGQETLLHTPGYYQSVRLSAGGNKIVWAETIYDVRWDNRNFSVIKILDSKTGETRMLTRHSRYFAPDISADGEKVVAVRIKTDNSCFLDILDAATGSVLQSFSLPGNVTFFKPVWDGAQRILVIVLTEKGKEIRSLNTSTGEWQVLYDAGYADIQSVYPWRQYVLFHYTLSGIDNIYALDQRNGHCYQVTSSRFGATDVTVSPSGDKLAYADYTSRGYVIAEKDLDPSTWVSVSANTTSPHDRLAPLLKQEKGVVESADIPDSAYTVEKYPKLPHLFRFHSWLPFYIDYENVGFDNFPVAPGVMLFTQNMLSTATGSVAYAYKDQHHQFISKFTYKGLFPVFDLSYNLGGQAGVSRDSAGIPLPAKIPVKNELSLKSYVPINLTNSRYSRGFVPSVEMAYSNSLIWDGDLGAYDEGQVLLSYRLYYYSLLKMGIRDIRPRLGFSLDAQYTHAPWDTPRYGTMGTFIGTAYLPGLLPHHTLRLRGGVEKQVPEKYYYYNRIPYPRGYDHWLSEKLSLLEAEYTFPLLYPDLGLYSFLYFSRLRGSLFWSVAEGERNYEYLNHTFIPGKKQFQSLGGELTVDFYGLRIGFPVSLGIWYAYLPNEKIFQSGVSFDVDVYGLSINRNRNKPIKPGWANLY